MFSTDLTVYPDHLKVIEACKRVNDCIVSISEFENIWYDVAKNETVPDYDGNEVRGRKDVKLYYLPIYDHASGYIEQKFKLVTDVLVNMTGVSRANVVFIGPRSIVPKHIDDDKTPAYTNSVSFNVYTGVNVPNGATIIINDELVVHEKHKAIIFDAQQPHSAYNDSDEWWISLLIYIDKDKFYENINA